MKSLLLLTCFLPFIASAQQSSRLVAHSHYVYDNSVNGLALRDSATYFFYGDNGGDFFEFKPHRFDSTVRMSTDGMGPLKYSHPGYER